MLFFYENYFEFLCLFKTMQFLWIEIGSKSYTCYSLGIVLQEGDDHQPTCIWHTPTVCENVDKEQVEEASIPPFAFSQLVGLRTSLRQSPTLSHHHAPHHPVLPRLSLCIYKMHLSIPPFVILSPCWVGF